MTELRERPRRERAPRGYAEPESVVDEPIGSHLLMAFTGVAGLLALLALFALGTGNLLHGWAWGAFAIPALLLAIAAGTALHTITERR